MSKVKKAGLLKTGVFRLGLNILIIVPTANRFGKKRLKLEKKEVKLVKEKRSNLS